MNEYKGEGDVFQEQGDRRGRGHVRLGRAQAQHRRNRAAPEAGGRSVLAGQGRQPQRPERALPPAMTESGVGGVGGGGKVRTYFRAAATFEADFFLVYVCSTGRSCGLIWLMHYLVFFFFL